MGTSAQYAEWIVRNAHKKGTPEFDTVAKAYAASRADAPIDVEVAPAPDAPVPESKPPQTADWKDLLAATPGVRMGMGVAAPVIGAFQLGANAGDWITEKTGGKPVVGQWVADRLKQYEESKQRGMDAGALAPGQSDLLGPVGTMVSGGALVSRLPQAGGWATRVAQGTAVGTGMGATAPSVTPGLDETWGNMKTGAWLGGGIPAIAPAVATLGKSAYRLAIEPYIDSASIKGRAYLTAAGDKVNEILNHLKSAEQIVPGSAPTAAQAASPAGRAEFSALGATAARVLPSKYVAQNDAANAARVNRIDTVAGTEASRASAEATRKANAATNYPAAFAEGIDKDVVKELKPQIDLLLKNPIIVQARKDAIDIAKRDYKSFSNMGDAESLEYVRRAIGKQIAATKDSNEIRQLMQVRDDLTHVIDQVAPKIGSARAAFKADSAPVNQQDVGLYLKNKLTGALDEEGPQKAASFAAAVRDAPGTIKRSLDGAPRFDKLTQVLTPEQNAAVESVRMDLAREARDKLLAQKGAQAAPNALNIASTSMAEATGGDKIVNPLSRIVTIANAIIDRMGNRIDKKLAIQIAEEMLSPQAVADSMTKYMKKKEFASKVGEVTNKMIAPTIYTQQRNNALYPTPAFEN